MSTPPAGRMNRSFHLLCGLNESTIFRLSERRTASISHGMKICNLKNYLALWLCFRHVYIFLCPPNAAIMSLTKITCQQSFIHRSAKIWNFQSNVELEQLSPKSEWLPCKPKIRLLLAHKNWYRAVGFKRFQQRCKSSRPVKINCTMSIILCKSTKSAIIFIRNNLIVFVRRTRCSRWVPIN